MAQYKAVTLDLAKTKIAWDKAQNDPKIAASGKAVQRPTVRQISPSNPGAGLQKVDKIEFLETKQSKLQEEIVAIRSDEDAQKPSTAGFVTFSSIATANAAAQTLQALAPGTVDVMMAPEPREIFWPGVIMPKLKRAAGGHTVTLLKIPLVWGYILAILFIASMQNLDSLTANPGMGWLSFINDLPAAVSGIIQGLVPVILLAVLMSMLPKILRAFAMKSGAVSESEIQTYVFGTHYASVVVTLLAYMWPHTTVLFSTHPHRHRYFYHTFSSRSSSARMLNNPSRDLSCLQVPGGLRLLSDHAQLGDLCLT
jgi:hypothetical protein